MNKIRLTSQLYNQYKHWLLLLYFPFYLLWFAYLEANVTSHYHIIHMDIDNYIPFCEIFIIPYLLWFGYIAATIFYMGVHDKKEYYNMCAFLFTGMTIFLIVSTIYPNGHTLRPLSFERDNIFTQLCSWLYQTDTATNLFPSIHVYNSIGVHLAIEKSEKTRHNRPLCLCSGILMVSIILSTVFLKQHSVFDVITGLFTALVVYQFVYVKNWKQTWQTFNLALTRTTFWKKHLKTPSKS